MSKSSPLILYDISSNHSQPFSFNTWKPRFALNIKKLPYKTTFVPLRDIESFCLSINASPTGKKPDGSPRYTLPVLHDPSTGRTISDSFAIVKYVDETYPQAGPRLLPDGSRVLQRAFISTFDENLYKIAPMSFIKTLSKFDEENGKRYRALIETYTGKKMEDIVPPPGTWEGIRKWFETLDEWYGEGQFVMGEEISLADVCVASHLLWAKRVFGEESQEWVEMMGWNAGRWARLVDHFKEFETVV